MKNISFCFILIFINSWTLFPQNQGNNAIWDFEIVNDGLIITNYKGNDTNIIIPNSINGLPVIGIETRNPADETWAGGDLRNGIIPYGRNEVTITLQSGIQYIGDFAFHFNRIRSVVIPDSVVSIGDYAFYLGREIESITIPGGLNLTGGVFDYGFVGLYNHLGRLRGTYTVNVSENDQWVYYAWSFNNRTMAIIGRYKGNDAVVTVPSSINGIPVIGIVGFIGFGAGAREGIFWGFDIPLTNLSLQEGIKYIDDYSFAIGYYNQNNNLLSIVIPNSVISIGSRAFGNLNIVQITIGEQIDMQNDSIGNGFVAFYINNGRKAGTYEYINGTWR